MTNQIKSNEQQPSSSSSSKIIQSETSNDCRNFTHTQISPNLTSMPYEIKEKVVYWVYWSHSHGTLIHQKLNNNHHDSNQDDDDDDGFEDISDSDSDSRYHKSNSKILTTSDSHDSESQRSDDHSTIQTRDSDDDCLIDIRSLASVDRTFYQICCPYLYQSFDSQGFTVSKLKLTLEEIIKRHSDHVKKVWWRVSKSELMEFEVLWNENTLDTLDWDPKSRSELLLQIFEACPNIIDLDIDLDPHPIIPLPDPDDDALPHHTPSSDPSARQMPNLFIKPIAQLTSLTHLALTSPTERPPYTESFLVDILANLSKLQSFGCSRVDATYPKPTDDRAACQSPLGIHLANLTELIELDFENVQCLDASWNQLQWKSSLKELTLEDCDRVSVSVLHGFVGRFESSLCSLALDNVPFHHDGTWNSDVILEELSNDQIKFELPKLTNLEVSNYLPIQFLKAFRPSKSILSISIDETPSYKHRDLEELIQDRWWPDLKKFSITNRTAFLSPGEIEGLEVLCQAYGIEMSIDEDSSDDEDGAGVDYDYDDEDLDGDDFEEEHWAHHHFGEDDDDDDEGDEDEE